MADYKTRDATFEIPNVKAIIGDSINMYFVKDNAGRGLVYDLVKYTKKRLTEKNEDGSLLGTPLQYSYVDGVGLVMKLNPWGENFLFDLRKKQPDRVAFRTLDAHFNANADITAITGQSIGVYPVTYKEAKDVQDYLAQAQRQQKGTKIPKLFEYKKTKSLGLVMQLTPHGENVFYDLDVLDQRISDYKSGMFESFDDTFEAKDIISIGKKSGIATLVGGDSHMTSEMEQTMFPGASIVQENYTPVSELILPSAQITFNKDGSIARDTHTFATRHFKRNG